MKLEMGDIQSIFRRLPQRFPFLLVDRVIEIIPGERIVALKNVTINEPYFQGHFPETPIMPGVLIVEAMAQAGGLLYSASLDDSESDRILYFSGMDRVRFRKPVVPGDALILKVEIRKQRASASKMTATAFVQNKLVAEAELMATYGEKP
jgi:3-hydroxyacyl-[acyl-carrier-protein] dehydratase